MIQPLIAKSVEDQSDDDANDTWSILADSAYQGLDRVLNVILPHKKPPNRQLTRGQKRHNKALASQRVSVKDFMVEWEQDVELLRVSFATTGTHMKEFLTNFHLLSYQL